MCSCVVKCCTAMNRAFNFVLSLVGLAVLAYALFLLDRNAWVASSALPVGLAGWGGALFLLAFGYATCGHRSAGYLTVYALLNLAFFLANGALLGYSCDSRTFNRPPPRPTF